MFVYSFCCVFFFSSRRRHTRCSRDWSSDVCSSDLAFYEQVVYDEEGQLPNASFMDYLLPTATDVPNVETTHRETRSPLTPVGTKGVGEAGAIPPGALFAQAVEDALAGSGLEICEMPLSPNRLFELMSASSPGEIGRASCRERV